MELAQLLSPTRDCACSATRKAARGVTAHFERHFRGSGLRATQFTILSTLAQAGPLPLTKLADLLGLERTTLTRNLDALVKNKLVADAAIKDGRVRLLELTAAGALTAERSFPLWKAAQSSVDGVLAQHALGRRATRGT